MQYRDTEAEHYWAGWLCLCGFFLHIALSDPLLNSIGFHYSGDEGRFYEKIHPATFFIFLSLCVFLWDGFNPVEKVFTVCRQHPAFMALLCMDSLALVYTVLRSGPAGLAFIIDTHISAAICAIVLSYAPRSLCRKAVHLLIVAAIINGIIGIAESVGKFRIFTFDPDWLVLHEEYFRASAFIGHPLDNAIFTAVALFVAMAMDYPGIIKAFIVVLFMAALAAFGGRAALLYSSAGLLILGGVYIGKIFSRREVTVRQIFTIIAVCMAVPLFLAVLFYVAEHDGMGERIAASITRWDSSADTRRLAFTVFSYMKSEEIWFGVSPERIMDIVYRMNLKIPLADIENPWIVMLMLLGSVVFPFWLIATLGFMRALLKNRPLALQLAVMAYFVIASTSNSFGRKDANYLIMVSAVICAARIARRNTPDNDDSMIAS